MSSEGEINIRGGAIAPGFHLGALSELNLFGTDFLIDGVPLVGLTLGAKAIVSERGAILSGVFADGSAFSFELNSNHNVASDTFFEEGAQLFVTLVPEPASIALFVIAGLMLPRRLQRAARVA